MSEVLIKRQIPLLITAVSAMIIVAGFFSPDYLGDIKAELVNWQIPLTTLMLWLGVIINLIYNIRAVLQKSHFWHWRLWATIVFTVYFVVGYFLGKGGSEYQYLYNNVVVPIGRASMVTVGMALLSGAYRGFRVRNVETFLLVLSGIICTAMMVGLSEAIHPTFFTEAGGWILDFPLRAAQRGMLIGAGMGMLALGIRTILGYEKTVVAE
jgi:hypothetical protein